MPDAGYLMRLRAAMPSQSPRSWNVCERNRDTVQARRGRKKLRIQHGSFDAVKETRDMDKV